MTLTNRKKRFIENCLLIDMPVNHISFSFKMAERDIFDGDRFVELNLIGRIKDQVVFNRADMIDFDNAMTAPGMVESNASKYGFPGLGIIYMRNLAGMLRDDFGFDCITLRAGSHSGAAVWAKSGFVLNYPETYDERSIFATREDLTELRDNIAKRAEQDPFDYDSLDTLSVIQKLNNSIAQGYVEKDDEHILWDIADFGDDGMAMLGALRYHMRLDLYDPIQMMRLERYAAQKVLLRTPLPVHERPLSARQRMADKARCLPKPA